MNVEENNGVQVASPEQDEPATDAGGVNVIALGPEGHGASAGENLAELPPAEASPGEDGATSATADQAAPDAEPEPGSVPEPDREAAPEQVSRPPPAPAPVDEHPRLRKHHVAPALIALDRIDEDDTFRIRPEGELSALATDIARLGQLFPIDIRLKPPDRFQVICGFRRVAALRFLQRDRVLARLHTDLGDEDALLMALVSAIHARPVERGELEAVAQKLEQSGRLTPAIRDMLEKAVSPDDSLSPETVDGEQEIDADELANNVTFRLGEINQDLALLADVFDALDDERKQELLKQLRYSSDLVAFLEGR